MKRVNIGIVLIILVLVGLGIYTVNVEKTKEEDKKYVLEFINNYFKIYNKYSMLDEKYRDIDKDIDKTEYSKYLAEMKVNLSHFVLEERLDHFIKKYKDRLDLQTLGKNMYNSYNKEIYEVTDYVFYKDYITVAMKLKMDVEEDKRKIPTFDKNTNRYIGEIKNLKGEAYPLETIIVKKVASKEYKIVYHSILDYISYPFELEEEGFFWTRV